MVTRRLTFFIVAVLAVHASSLLPPGRSLPTFAAFVEEHGRTYREGSAEFQVRQDLFEQRVSDYERHNRNPLRLWTASANTLTDRTNEELLSLRGWSGVAAKGVSAGLRGVSRPVARHNLGLRQQSGQLPSNVSWAHLESLQTVAHQGGCGSCWAHATALAMDANYEIKRGSRQKFSVAELVNCSPNPHHCGGSGGCDGSTAEVAMLYVMHQGFGDTPACRAPTSDLLRASALGSAGSEGWESILVPGVHVVPQASPARQLGLVGWERLPENRAEPLMQAVVDWGPVVVAVAANYWAGYTEGVLDACPRDVVIDHAVVLLGFGKDDSLGVDFWHIRNSWGESWGENGSIRLLRSDADDDFCGIDTSPDVGTGCFGGPKRVTVCGMCGILYDSVVPHFIKQ